jgi:TonB family protein
MKIRFPWFGLLAFAPAALAQQVFVSLEGNTPQTVHGIAYGKPLIEVDGKLVSGTGIRYALMKSKAPAYRPGLIKIRSFHALVGQSGDQGAQTLFPVEISGYLESNVPLKRCFIVFQINSGFEKGRIFYNEVLDLPVGEERKFDIVFSTLEDVQESQFEVHVFSDGLELLNSLMPPEYIAEQTKKTQDLLAQSHAEPAGAKGALPESRAVALSHDKHLMPAYPAELKPKALVGTAKVSCTISAQGDVVSAVVVEATDPLFGEAAVAAVRQWKFEPAVKDHQYVEATAIIPFKFNPPAADAPAKDAPKP